VEPLAGNAELTMTNGQWQITNGTCYLPISIDTQSIRRCWWWRTVMENRNHRAPFGLTACVKERYCIG
jgi:hypothetical protein